jgi:hypothetical protein
MRSLEDIADSIGGILDGCAHAKSVLEKPNQADTRKTPLDGIAVTNMNAYPNTPSLD